MPGRDRSLYRGSFPARSKAVRDAANADPSTRCRRCGLTLAEFVEQFPDRKARWQAGHAIDGVHLSPLVPEHTYCNAAAGARTRNRKQTRIRVAGGINNSERWY